MKFLFAIVLFSLSAQTMNAQLSKVIHQTYDINDAETVSLQITGEYKIEKWAGNTIMTETSIELYDAKPSILKHFVEHGRYEILSEENDATYFLKSKDSERKAIKTKKGECYEFVKIRIFIPEDFEVVNENSLVRVDPDEDN